MSKSYSKAILASYATFTELYNSGKYTNPYQILSEFLLYTIKECGLFSFQLSELKGRLYDVFGFEPPLYVIKRALKRMSGITNDENSYYVNVELIKNNEKLKDYQDQSKSSRDRILKLLSEFVIKTFPDEQFETKKLEQELIAYLIDEDGEDRYRQVISEFVLANDSNNDVAEKLKTIREGCILYTGLSYDIDDFGSLQHNLTLFLDTEIIFDIAGFNGELYKSLADDFLKLIDDANKGQQRIKLKFFSEVKDEIEQYFVRAEAVVAGNGEAVIRPAMKAIVTKCKSSADVLMKKVDLYRDLHLAHRIVPDDRETYNRDDDFKYNLEGTVLPNFKEKEANEGLRFCSHINKLRKGELYKEPLSSGFLAITDTRRVIAVSDALIAEKNNEETGDAFCGFALSLSKITNDLWYKLNRGFSSKVFPENLDCAIKARSVLSSYVSQGVSDFYKDIVEKAKNNEMPVEKATEYILALREKKCTPDEITLENAEENLCFKNSYFEQQAAQRENDKRKSAEKDEVNRQLQTMINELRKQMDAKDVALKEDNARREQEDKKYKDQIEQLKETVSGLQSIIQANEEEKIRIEKKKKRNKAIRNIVFKGAAVVLIIAVIVLLCVHYKKSIINIGGFVFGLVSIIPVVRSIFVKEVSFLRGQTEKQRESDL